MINQFISIKNIGPPRPVPPPPIPTKPNEQLTNYPWFISTCLNRNDAARILQSCPTIEVKIILVCFLKIESYLWFRMEIFSFVKVKIKMLNIR